jgi:hypothetical protein
VRVGRRELIALIAGAAAAGWPLTARAQDWERDRVYRIGFLIPTPRKTPVVDALFDELRINGLVEGQNLQVTPGSFEVQNDQLPTVAASFVAASPDVIICGPELPIRALHFLATPLFSVNAADFISQVRELGLASIYQWPEDAEDGALSAYGPRYSEMYRLRARLLMKVLRGAKPADIPVEQPAKFELIFNLKTAKAIGLNVPSSLLPRADKVIE